jgi:hypothetical protein
MIRALVIVARADEDPVTGPRGVNSSLNRAERPGDPVVHAHPKHLGRCKRSQRQANRRGNGCGYRATHPVSVSLDPTTLTATTSEPNPIKPRLRPHHPIRMNGQCYEARIASANRFADPGEISR